MKKLFLMILLLSSSIFAGSKNDLEYQKETTLKVVHGIGAGVGGTLGSPGLLVTIPAFIIVNDLMRNAVSLEFNLANDTVARVVFSPVYYGAKAGKAVAQPIATKLLARKYGLSYKAVSLSIKYGLTLEIYKDFLFAAELRAEKKLVKLLAREMYLLFGVHWQKELIAMFNDSQRVFDILNTPGLSSVERNARIHVSPLFQNYNEKQLELFALTLRLLLVTYQLYHDADLPTEKCSKIEFDEYLNYHASWADLVAKMGRKVTKSEQE